MHKTLELCYIATKGKETRKNIHDQTSHRDITM